MNFRFFTFLTLLLCLSLPACATSGPQPAPTKFDAAIWTIQTNTVWKTNVIEQTNVTEIGQLVTVTNNFTNTVAVWSTNITQATNVVLSTNYYYLPGQTAAAVETAATTFGGPWGAVAGGALSLILGVWGSFKSRQASTSTAIAGNATQAIAVLRNVVAAMPNGPTLTSQVNAFLAAHEADANIAQEVAQLIDTVVDPNAAHGAADLILKNLVTPIPTAAATVTTPKPS